MVQTASLLCTHAFVLEFDSEARLPKRPGNVWNCLLGHRMSPGINRKSRVLYPGPGFISSATWPPVPKNNYNGLINQMAETAGFSYCDAMFDHPAHNANVFLSF